MPNRKGGAAARQRRHQRNNALMVARKEEERRKLEESLQTKTETGKTVVQSACLGETVVQSACLEETVGDSNLNRWGQFFICIEQLMYLQYLVTLSVRVSVCPSPFYVNILHTVSKLYATQVFSPLFILPFTDNNEIRTKRQSISTCRLININIRNGLLE